MHPNPFRLLCGATVLAVTLGGAGGAQAGAQLELTGRQSSVSLGGITSASTLALAPNAVRLQGETEFLRNESFLFYAELQAGWNIGQRFDIGQDGADTRLRASSDFLLETRGSAGFDDDDETDAVCGLPCVTDDDHPYTSLNTLSLTFSLSESTSFAASGRSAKGQVTRLHCSGDGGATWAHYVGWNEFLTFGGSPLFGEQATTVWAPPFGTQAAPWRPACTASRMPPTATATSLARSTSGPWTCAWPTRRCCRPFPSPVPA